MQCIPFFGMEHSLASFALTGRFVYFIYRCSRAGHWQILIFQTE